jgi:hypothetical protein
MLACSVPNLSADVDERERTYYRGGMTEQGESGEWDPWPPPEGADSLRLRWRRDDSGRWVVTDLHLHAETLTSGMLRAVSLPRIEAQRNAFGPGVPDGGTQENPGVIAAAWEILAAGAPAHYDIPANAPRQRITRPDRTDPEQLKQFYRRVAMAYRQYAQERSPAPAIAEEAGVPVTTVHRWVREARRRGFLPPGRKGQVG